MGGRRVGDALGEWHVASLSALRKREDQTVPHDLELPNDMHDAPLQVEVFGRESQDLALAQTAAAAQVDSEPVATRQPCPHGVESLETPRHDLARVRPR